MIRPRFAFRITFLFWLAPLAIGWIPCSTGAESVCSSQSVRRIAAAAEMFDRKEFLPSGSNLCDVIKREETCAEALWVQSFLSPCVSHRYYQDAAVLKPAEMKRRALALNPGLAEAWRQNEPETDGIQTQAFEHFDVRFFASEDRQSAWDANQILSGIYNEMGSAFGYFPDERMRVLIYTNDTVVRHWRNISQGGFFNLSDGTIRVRADAQPSGELSFRSLLRREFAKAYFIQRSFKGWPGWMREGTADFYAHRDTQNGVWIDDRLKHIRAHFVKYNRSKIDLSMPLAKMETLYLNKRIVTSLGKTTAYLQAEAIVLSIAKDRGESWIPQVVEKMTRGATWLSAYQEVVGVPPEQILEQFHKTWKPSGAY